MSGSEADIGSYLHTVEERDIDLLLMEEFHSSEPFISWFCGRINLTGNVSFAGAWHSVSNADGETDLLLRVRSDNQLVGIMIENKVAAPEQPQQDERYHIRGVRMQQERKFDAFFTCICAPQSYLEGLATSSLYQFRVSYEAIAEWFEGQTGLRDAWRLRIIREAIQHSRRGYKMAVNQMISDFHMAYWEYLRKRHPRIAMTKPTPKGSKSNWIILKGREFPKGVRLHHKFDQRVVELGFDGRDVSEILAIKNDWPDDMIPVQKNRTAAISVDVPWIDMTKSVTTQKESLEVVFAAAYRLFPFAQLLIPRNAS